MSIPYPNVPLHEVMRAAARRYPDRTAIWFNGAGMSLAEFDAESNRLAHGLSELGLRNGDRLALFLPNCPQYELGFYAASKLGAVACPLNPSYRAFEITHQLNDSGATVLLAHANLWPLVQAVRPELRTLREVILVGASTPSGPTSAGDGNSGFAPGGAAHVHSYEDVVAHQSFDPPSQLVQLDQLAALPYSSGTTGTPKGVMLTHRNLVSNHVQFATASRLGPDDVYFVYLPLSHIYGVALMGMALSLGIQQIVMERFDLATVVRLTEEKGVTWLHAVPPILVALANAPGLERSQFRSVRFVLNAAAPLAPDIARRVENRLGLRVVQAYGLTETSPDTHHSPLDPGRIKLESGGVPVADTEHRVVDLETGERTLGPGEVGEIVVRGPQVMQGYWNAPEETARALRHGWLYTGDIGHIDSEGYVFISDRKKEMIKYKAFSIAPAELEAVLFEHPDVADCGVIGVPDTEAGQVPKAFVVPRAGRAIDLAAVAQFVASRVAGYKQIRQWAILDKIPRTPSGKILRRSLKELAIPAKAAPAAGSIADLRNRPE